MLCPIISNDEEERSWSQCQKVRGKGWTRTCKLEGIVYYDCAIVINAIKNSDGKVDV